MTDSSWPIIKVSSGVIRFHCLFNDRHHNRFGTISFENSPKHHYHSIRAMKKNAINKGFIGVLRWRCLSAITVENAINKGFIGVLRGRCLSAIAVGNFKRPFEASIYSREFCRKWECRRTVTNFLPLLLPWIGNI